MNLEELSNFFTINAELVIGIPLHFKELQQPSYSVEKENGLMQMFGNLFG